MQILSNKRSQGLRAFHVSFSFWKAHPAPTNSADYFDLQFRQTIKVRHNLHQDFPSNNTATCKFFWKLQWKYSLSMDFGFGSANQFYFWLHFVVHTISRRSSLRKLFKKSCQLFQKVVPVFRKVVPSIYYFFISVCIYLQTKLSLFIIYCITNVPHLEFTTHCVFCLVMAN